MNKHSVLIIGSGGREHALAWKLKQSPKVGKIYIAPGNAGTAEIAENVPLNILDNKKIVEFAKKNKVDLVVVPCDDPLANGLVNNLQEAGIKAFGPTQEAAEIEWSKSFAKKLMIEENIPTAKYKEFTEYKKAINYLKKQNFPIVVKADGLALGKGVVIAKNMDEAEKALNEMIIAKVFGKSGEKVVIEEFLTGVEISIHVFSDGKSYSVFPSSKDHKTIYDNNCGPNTGGMGTIAPVPGVTDKLMAKIEKIIIQPTLNGLKKRGRKFVGVLYPGLIITKNGPKVLEFNARFGDPETESYMRLLDTDLFDVFMNCIDEKLDKLKIKWKKQASCCVIIASGDYPVTSEKGIEINGIQEAEKNQDIIVFHAGTKQIDDKIKTNGGRVLGVTSTGKNLGEALEKTYSAIKKIKFAGMQYRTDIGKYTLKEQF